MNAPIEQITERIAAEVIAHAQKILSDSSIAANSKSGVNTLRNSTLAQTIKSDVRTLSNGDVIIDTLFGNYLRYIEQDRPPKHGKMPPVSALRDWALKNSLPTDNDTLWAIAYAIWRDGHAGRPILLTLEKELDKKWERDWAKELFECLTNELNNYFKQ